MRFLSSGDPSAQNPPRRGLLSRIREGLARTRQGFTEKLVRLTARGRAVDDDFFDELEELLIEADVGVRTAAELVEELRERARRDRLRDGEDVRAALGSLLVEQLKAGAEPLRLRSDGPTVIMLVGVNGSGKTTTAGKLARRFREEGKSVILGAADTFRAAAIEQLTVWGERTGSTVIAQSAGADPAAVAFDAVQAALARGADVLLVDTAGRLQTQSNLMRELEKVQRVMERRLGRPVDEVLLVLDATVGQNAISQGKHFREAVSVSGIVLTKLDGTARGGIVVALARELGLPVKLVGVGEGADDLRDFDPEAFVEALINP